MVLLFTFEVLIYISIEDFISHSLETENIFKVIEVIILGVFILDIVLNVIAFRRNYFNDKIIWIDIAITLLTIVFHLIDLLTGPDNEFLKIKGLFRILRIFLLFRKVSPLSFI